jgi:hypothetical protein
MFHPRMVRRFRLSFLLLALATLLEPILCLLQALTRGHHILGTERVFWYVSIIVALYVLYAVVLLVHREIAFRHVDGANDNASGVAVMLSLAESLAQQRPAATEIVMLATGCEEVGMVGMEAFIRRHREEMDRAWIINIDNVGAGEVTFITEEGMLIPWPADSQLLDVADSIVRLPGWNMEGRPFRVMSTDAQPALLRRLQAMTIIALEDGLPVNWHWETDTVENIDAETVDTAFRLGEAMAKRLVA